jgi:plasmid stabilization system protein ParE
MKYEVIITPSAKADIFEINTWLLENYPDFEEKWLWQISEAMISLSRMPKRCPVSEESSAFDIEVRQLLCGNKRHVYRILFLVEETNVYILRVRSTRQRRLIDQIDE